LLAFGLTHAAGISSLIAWQAGRVAQRSDLADLLLGLFGEMGRGMAWAALAALSILLLLARISPAGRLSRIAFAAAVWALIPSAWWFLADAGAGLTQGLLGWMVMYAEVLHYIPMVLLLAELLASALQRRGARHGH
jgi:hypothetical protein